MLNQVSKIVGGGIILGLFILVVQLTSLNDSVFSIVPKEKKLYSLDEYVKIRDQRNKVKMKLSYDDLMINGDEDTKEENWASAIGNYYYAKSIYPDRIEPRRQLCYVLLMECQEDYRACDKAKKELYYAMKYVHPNDRTNLSYLEELVQLMDLESVIELDEQEALAQIY